MAIMNMDRCVNPKPVTFIAPVDGLERGIFVEIKGMAKNNIFLANVDDFEAYEVELANANTEVKNLLIHTTVPKQYDERLDERDFVANEGTICRGHYIQIGDEYTIAKEFVGGDVQVGAEVALASDGKLAVGAEKAIGEIVKVYIWNGQESVMIRFY
jgi:hypothetical protein